MATSEWRVHFRLLFWSWFWAGQAAMAGVTLDAGCGGGTGLNLIKPGGGVQGMTQHDLPIGSQGRGHSLLPGQGTLCPLLPL